MHYIHCIILFRMPAFLYFPLTHNVVLMSLQWLLIVNKVVTIANNIIWTFRYRDTCPKIDAISFPQKDFVL